MQRKQKKLLQELRLQAKNLASSVLGAIGVLVANAATSSWHGSLWI